MNKFKYKLSQSYRDKIKVESIKAIVLISFMLVLIPPIIFMDYWYIAVITGMALIPFWVKFRWNVYHKEIIKIDNHSLKILDNSLEMYYSDTKHVIGLDGLKSIDVNLKKGESVALCLSLSGGFKLYLSDYEKMNQIESYLTKLVGKTNVKRHRWFHKY